MKLVPRYILPSYVDIIETLKRVHGFSVVPKNLCEEALKQKNIKIPIGTTNRVEEELFYSFKLKNKKMKEVISFKEKLQEMLVKK